MWAVVAGVTDMSYNTVGYGLVGLNDVATALYLILVSTMADKKSLGTLGPPLARPSNTHHTPHTPLKTPLLTHFTATRFKREQRRTCSEDSSSPIIGATANAILCEPLD